MTNLPIKIAPSILSADFSRLGDEVKAIDEGGCDWVHIDIMDGHFVPNISFGPIVVDAIRPATKKFFDVHLMISPTDMYLEAFANARADAISVHAEAGPHLDRSLQAIRNLGKKAGVAINPATPISTLENVLDRIDLIVLMSVNPGFGGQAFIPQTLEKIRQAKALIGDRQIDIEIDGGVTEANAGEIAAAGATVLVAGSSVYKGNVPSTYGPRIDSIRSAAKEGRA